MSVSLRKTWNPYLVTAFALGVGHVRRKTIEPGDKIEWNWDSSFHSTTSGTPGNPSGMWDSGVHQTGYKFEYEFNKAGSFPYYCSVHGGCCSMTGTVNVSMPSPSP